MGVLNATPDSFSDAGRHPTAVERLARGWELVAEGADIVDVGGESGVTDRPAVSAEEEMERVVPLVEALAAWRVPVSVDTWKAPVARAALEAGAAMVNDTSGLRDPDVADACAAAGAALVVTHTRAAPKQKAFPGYADVAEDVRSFLREAMASARRRGVALDGIVLDPGVDLAKTPAETVAVLRALPGLHELGRPLLLAVSRKDFVGALTGRSPGKRLGGTLAAIGAGVDAGAAIVRVHDVRQVRDYLSVRAVLRGEEEVTADLHLAPGLRQEAAPT